MQNFSLTVAKIEMFRRNGAESIEGALGTGFFYRSADHLFLITNWHNVTGLDAVTQKALHSQGLLPNFVRIHYKQWSDPARSAIRSHGCELALYKDDKPIWFEHSNRFGVDVVAIPLSMDLFTDFANLCINEVPQQNDLEVSAGMDCFILGFPEGLFGAAFTPIWKRGSIASEPFKNYPYYVDSATRKGMSGSPVIARHTGFYGTNGTVLTGNEIIGTVERFIAIYSGRVGDDALGFQLGTAWQSTVLDDILTLATLGSHPLG